jgi:hypothetical protein
MPTAVVARTRVVRRPLEATGSMRCYPAEDASAIGVERDFGPSVRGEEPQPVGPLQRSRT